MREMLESLGSDVELGANKALMENIADMTLLASHLEALDVIDKVSFDLSLARGLDYYTGLIYEMVVADSASRVGSIAAGVGVTTIWWAFTAGALCGTSAYRLGWTGSSPFSTRGARRAPPI